MAKKATRAELLQSWSQPSRTWETIPTSLSGNIQQPRRDIYLDRAQGLLYCPAPSGLLEPWADCSAPLQARPCVRFCKSGGHVTAYGMDVRFNAKTRSRSEPWRAESTLTLLWDSEGQVPCPFHIEFSGKCVRFDLRFAPHRALRRRGGPGPAGRLGDRPLSGEG